MPVLETEQELFVTVTFDRSRRMPCINISPFIDGSPARDNGHSFPFKYGEAIKESVLQDWITSATCEGTAIDQVSKKSNLASIIGNLIEVFYKENAVSVFVRIAKSSDEDYVVNSYRFELDDAALRLNKTPEELQILREEQKLLPEEVEAAKDGIVYWR